jgi:hypothetical protein
MKQLYFFTLFSLLCFSNLKAQDTTIFNWDTNTVDNGSTITQTLSGISATFTPSPGPTIRVLSEGNPGVFNFAIGSSVNNDNVIITFSEPINVQTIFVFQGLLTSPTADWTFTPTGGANSPVIESVEPSWPGEYVTLNWTEVTGITITSSEGPDFFGIDDINYEEVLSTQEFNNTKPQVKLFPNPSTDYIQLSNLTQTENYTIYNVLGAKILKGNISDEEKINVQSLSNGLYILKFDNGEAMKFVKE